MTFQRLDGILAETFERLGIEDAGTERSAVKRARPPGHHGKGGRAQPRSELKGTPTEAGAEFQEVNYPPEGDQNVVLFLPTIGRDMATARRGAEPHGSAVVISMLTWKRDHGNSILTNVNPAAQATHPLT